MQQSSTENIVQLELEYVCTGARYTVQFSAACSAGPFASYSASFCFSSAFSSLNFSTFCRRSVTSEFSMTDSGYAQRRFDRSFNAGMSIGNMINADDDIQQIVDITCKQPQNTDITAHNNQQKTESAAPTDLMLLLLKMKQCLTKEATVDIAKLINVMMNAESQMP